MKRATCIFAALLVLAGAYSTGTDAHAAGPVELKAVSYVDKTHPFMEPMGFEWIKRINEALKDEVRVKYVGGPEAIPSLEQIDAVMKNVVQVGFFPTAIYKNNLIEAHALVQARNTPSELRKGGFHDLMVKEHERIRMHFTGLFHWGQFYMWVRKNANHVADLKGLKMRTMALYDQFQKALGITPVTVAPADVFTALERGVVDGFCFPLAGPRESGWTTSTKYVINHPFYSLDLVININLDTWNKLPKAVQAKIDDITAKYEPDMVAHLEKMLEKEWGLLEKAGVKKIVFPEQEAKDFVETAYRVKWEELARDIKPEKLETLKKLTGN